MYARHQDGLTDWPSVVTWLWLTESRGQGYDHISLTPILTCEGCILLQEINFLRSVKLIKLVNESSTYHQPSINMNAAVIRDAWWEWIMSNLLGPHWLICSWPYKMRPTTPAAGWDGSTVLHAAGFRPSYDWSKLVSLIVCAKLNYY
jgi:hypothetical protein